jgi:hypothetical protein
MSALLSMPPFSPRDDSAFLRELNELVRWHRVGCPAFAAMWPSVGEARALHEVPFVHVGLFKRMNLRTSHAEISHQRTLNSSATSGGNPSQIILDERSSALQSTSSAAILRELLGSDPRPLLILDHASALRAAGQVSARLAAALSLRPLASSLHFLMEDPSCSSVDVGRLACAVGNSESVIVYGFTSALWTSWASQGLSRELARRFGPVNVSFVHSGGWKKLESMKVSRATFDGALVEGLGPRSQVVDFYGLVEQVGVIFPLCSQGHRHAPRWSGVLVRDPWTMQPLTDQPGMLQLINVLAWGAPYFSVLTEDMGRLIPGQCSCGWRGHRFELLGRVPKAEVRGCANV